MGLQGTQAITTASYAGCNLDFFAHGKSGKPPLLKNAVGDLEPPLNLNDQASCLLSSIH